MAYAVAPEEKEKLKIIHKHLSAILRVFNSSHKLDAGKFALSLFGSIFFT